MLLLLQSSTSSISNKHSLKIVFAPLCFILNELILFAKILLLIGVFRLFGLNSLRYSVLFCSFSDIRLWLR